MREASMSCSRATTGRPVRSSCSVTTCRRLPPPRSPSATGVLRSPAGARCSSASRPPMRRSAAAISSSRAFRCRSTTRNAENRSHGATSARACRACGRLSSRASASDQPPSRGSFTPRKLSTTSSARPTTHSVRTSRGRFVSRNCCTATLPHRMSRPATAANPTTITGARYAARCTDQPSARAVTTTSASTTPTAIGMRSERTRQGYAWTVEAEAHYNSGDDYLVEFLGYSFSFNAEDFEQRVTAAAVKLGLIPGNELDGDETADLVELVEIGSIEEPRSALGRYLVRRWDEVSLVGGESLLDWLKRLVFRGAWLDHHV